jgi:Carboxypeptidase regulatory-like domain/TonB dependent receptor
MLAVECSPEIAAHKHVYTGTCFGPKAQEAVVKTFLLRAMRIGNTYSRCFTSKAGRVPIGILTCAVMSLVFCTAARAQTSTGQFTGHVFDQNGAVVADASVALQDAQTNQTRTTKTNGEGLYIFPLIQPGTYSLTVTQTGFDTATSPQLKLDVNQVATQDFKLQIGATSQTVSVTATAEGLQSSGANLGAVVEQRAVNSLPLNGRSFSALLTLTPGSNPVNYSQNGSVGYGTGFGSAGIPGSTYTFPSTQGQWNRENLYYLDGIINTAAFASSYDVPPIVDAIQEFKIQSHNDQAEFGSVLGGVVNLVTKSGSNSFHGALWEYLRNNAFDSRNPFTDFKGNVPAPPASFRQNEYGGDVGGPVWIPKLYNGKDKTFFFAAYEGWRYSKAAGASYISPTEAELNGDFSNSSIVTSTGAPALLYNPFTTTGTAGNYTRQLLGDGHHIPAGMINPGMQAFLKGYSDTPNFTPTTIGGSNTILNSVGTNNANAFTGRIDQNFGSTNTLWFRFSFLDGTSIAPSSHHASGSTTADNRNYGGGYTHTFSPTFLLDATAGYSGRFNTVSTTAFTGVPAGSDTAFTDVEQVYGHPNFGYTASSSSSQTGLTQGYNGIGGGGPAGSESHEFNFAVNMTWIHGNHQVRFGFEEQIPEMTQGLSGGHFGGATFTFATAETADPQNASSTGNPLAGALLGIPDNGRFQSEVNAVRTIVPSAYIQDSWKVTPRLTLNGGLRWDGESSPHLLNGTTAAMLDPNTGNWIVSGGKLPPPCNAASGVYAPCIPSTTPANNAVIAAHVLVAPNPNLGPDPTYKDFGPRFGFAYKVDPTTVIRGGYGLIYDNLTGSIQTVRDRLLAWPSNASLPLVFNVIGQPLDTIDQIIPTLSSTKALPAVATPFNQFGWYYDPHLKNHYSHQFNLEVQKQLTSSLTATIGYVGSVDRHLPITGLANNSPEAGGAGLDRPFPWSGTALEATARGESNFNALETKIDKRLSNGLSFGTGFTWSKAMDNGGSGFYGVENGPQSYSTFQNYNDLNADYGISGNSLKFIYYGWAVYELPFGKNQPYLTHGVGAAVLGGWQANANIAAHSGVPLGVPDAGLDPANIGNTGTYNYARANLIGNPKVSHPTKSMAFNTAAFAHPVNQYGNSGRGIFTAMPYDNIDFSLMKSIPVKESFGFQFRAEFFNIFNIQNYGLPGTTFGGTGFGVISSLAGGATPRQIQLSLRANF